MSSPAGLFFVSNSRRFASSVGLPPETRHSFQPLVPKTPLVVAYISPDGSSAVSVTPESGVITDVALFDRRRRVIPAPASATTNWLSGAAARPNSGDVNCVEIVVHAGASA